MLLIRGRLVWLDWGGEGAVCEALVLRLFHHLCPNSLFSWWKMRYSIRSRHILFDAEYLALALDAGYFIHFLIIEAAESYMMPFLVYKCRPILRTIRWFLMHIVFFKLVFGFRSTYLYLYELLLEKLLVGIVVNEIIPPGSDLSFLRLLMLIFSLSKLKSLNWTVWVESKSTCTLTSCCLIFEMHDSSGYVLWLDLILAGLLIWGRVDTNFFGTKAAFFISSRLLGYKYWIFGLVDTEFTLFFEVIE